MMRIRGACLARGRGFDALIMSSLRLDDAFEQKRLSGNLQTARLLVMAPIQIKQ